MAASVKIGAAKPSGPCVHFVIICKAWLHLERGSVHCRCIKGDMGQHRRHTGSSVPSQRVASALPVPSSDVDKFAGRADDASTAAPQLPCSAPAARAATAASCCRVAAPWPMVRAGSRAGRQLAPACSRAAVGSVTHQSLPCAFQQQSKAAWRPQVGLRRPVPVPRALLLLRSCLAAAHRRRPPRHRAASQHCSHGVCS